MAGFNSANKAPDRQMGGGHASPSWTAGQGAPPGAGLAMADFCARAVNAVTLALLVWMAMAILVRDTVAGPQMMILILFFATVLFFIFFPRRGTAKVLGWPGLRKRILPTVAILLFAAGLAARFGFMAFEYVPMTDPGHYFDNAASLSQTGVLRHPFVIGMFPYLYAYDALLAGMFHITGSGLLGVILLNSAFDVFAAFLVGHLVYLHVGSRKWQLLTSVFWWISPYNIIFCAISLPIIVVNALILAVLVSLVYLFTSAGHFKRILVASVATSGALAAEDAFRPIAVVTIIAVVVYYAVFLLKERKLTLLRNCVLSIMIIAVLSGAAGYGWQQAVNAAAGLPANTSKQGWSVYVGSNYETSGAWNQQDADYRTSLIAEYGDDYVKAFDRLQREGIDRWKALGPAKAIGFIVKKSILLAGGNESMIYNLPASYPYWMRHGSQYNALQILCAVYWFVMLAFAIYLLFQRRWAKDLDFVGFLGILTIGLFLAFMAVEVANRYFTVFFPMFTVFAVLGLRSAMEPLPGSHPCPGRSPGVLKNEA